MVARDVLGSPDGPVPPYSRDRTAAHAIVREIWRYRRHLAVFDRIIKMRLPVWAEGGPGELLLMVEPDDICRAALVAVRECGPLNRAANQPPSAPPPPAAEASGETPRTTSSRRSSVIQVGDRFRDQEPRGVWFGHQPGVPRSLVLARDGDSDVVVAVEY